MQYNTEDNQLDHIWFGYLELSDTGDFSKIYDQIENVSNIQWANWNDNSQDA